MKPRPAGKRCLLIAGVFPPAGGAGAIRLAKLCKFLGRRGWRVDVLAPPGEAGWTRDAELLGDVAGCAVERLAQPLRLPAKVAALRVAAKDPRSTPHLGQVAGALLRLGRKVRNHLFVPDELLPWSLLAAGVGQSRVRAAGYDVVLTSTPPHSVHLAGLAVARASHVPWVAELRDPWVGNPTRGAEGPLRRGLNRHLERAVIERAGAVVVVSPGMAADLEARWGSMITAKLRVIPNGFDPADRPPARDAPPARPFELAYVGSFDSTLTPVDAFLAALSRLGQKHEELAARLRLRFVGSADLRASEALRAYLRGRRPVEIRIDGPVSHGAAVAAMHEADALLLLLAPEARWVLTSKVFEYLGAGRPILAVVPEGDCHELLRRCGNAVVVDPGEPERLDAILTAAASTGRLAVEQPRDDGAVAAYAWPRLASVYDDLLGQLAVESQKGGGERRRPGSKGRDDGAT